MEINKRYALFDWDNTVRNDYTLFSWVEYLCTHGIIDPSFQNELDLVAQQYNENIITHDQYAEMACSKYAKSLKGIDYNTIDDIILDYIDFDRSYLFEGVDLIFDLLYANGIDIIVISGAPSIILEKYQQEFHIKKIFAFKEQIENGIFTGNVEYNYGFNKERKLNEIEEEYSAYPYLAFGDSESDIPMLNSSAHAFCINYALTNDSYINIDSKKFSFEIIKNIKQLL